MIDLTILGRLDVRDAEGLSIAELCSRPKTAALLVYLAVARPRGFHAQDALLATFWPEADTARAQLSLRQSLHLLRRFLGDEVVLRRGRAEIGLESGHLCCDVLRFDEAIESGALEAALDEYKGELLPGFHVFDAPEFERWLDAERRRCREDAIAAARTLTVRAHDAHDTLSTGRWSRRWLSLASNDPEALQHAIDALATAGEYAAALRTYDDFVAALGDDGDAPSPETERLIAVTREQLVQRAASVAVAVAVASTMGEPAAAATSGTIAETRRSIRRVPAMMAAAAVVAIVLAGLGRWIELAGATRAPTDAERHATSRIAVLPFAVRGDTRLGYLSEGMVDLLSAKLDGVGGLSTVDPRIVLADSLVRASTSLEPERGRQIARQQGAGQFVLGSVVESGGHIEISAGLYGADGARRAMANGSAPDESHMLAAVDKVARELMVAQFADTGAHMERVAATTTGSMPALRAFLEGERAMRSGQTMNAVDAFQRAILADSTFALAHYRLSTSARWSDDPALVQRAVLAAVRYADRLPQHERLALTARSAVERGDADDADRQYRDLVARYPADADAWNQLAELQFHTGPWRGNPLSESRAAFEHVVALQPGHVSALLHLTRLAALDHRVADVASLTRRAMTVTSDREVALELRGLRAAEAPNAAEHRELLSALRAVSAGGSNDDVRLVAWRIATFTDDPNEGEFLVAPLLDAANPTALRLRGRAALVHMDAARGLWNAARRELRLIDLDDPALAAELRANIALSRPQVLASAERTEARRVLLALASAIPTDVLRPARRAYLGGTLALADGDTRGVALATQRLTNLRANGDADADLAAHLVHQLAARVLWLRGDARAALREVEVGWPTGSARLSLPLYQGDGYAHAHERFFRGVLLVALRRDAEAARWMESIPEDQGASLLLSAQAHLARAQIAVRGGDAGPARLNFQRALALWGRADEAAKPDLEEAEHFVLSGVGRSPSERRDGR